MARRLVSMENKNTKNKSKNYMKRQIKYPSEKTLQKRVGYTELIPKARYNGVVCPKCGCREFSLYRIKVNTVAYCTKCLSYIKFVSKEDLEKIVERHTGVKKITKARASVKANNYDEE